MTARNDAFLAHGRREWNSGGRLRVSSAEKSVPGPVAHPRPGATSNTLQFRAPIPFQIDSRIHQVVEGRETDT